MSKRETTLIYEALESLFCSIVAMHNNDMKDHTHNIIKFNDIGEKIKALPEDGMVETITYEDCDKCGTSGFISRDVLKKGENPFCNLCGGSGQKIKSVMKTVRP